MTNQDILDRQRREADNWIERKRIQEEIAKASRKDYTVGKVLLLAALAAVVAVVTRSW